MDLTILILLYVWLGVIASLTLATFVFEEQIIEDYKKTNPYLYSILYIICWPAFLIWWAKKKWFTK